MSNNKQSSVDFIVNLLVEKGYAGVLNEDEIEQAQAKHKSEVTEAFYIGRYEYNNFDSDSTEYYNETFKK